MKDRELADEVTAVDDRKGLNKELKDRKQREEQRERKAHQNETGRFLEEGLPVQLWVTLKVLMTMTETEAWCFESWSGPRRRRRRRRRGASGWRAPWAFDLWWDDAFKRCINELQRRVGFTVGYIRADEARPYRHIHVAIVAHQLVAMRDVQEAWLTVIGSKSREAAWVEPYRRQGGGIWSQAKADGEHRCDWQFSPNIDLFRLSGDGKIHRPSTSRQRRDARRIREQRVGATTPQNAPSPAEHCVQPGLEPKSSVGGSRPRADLGCLQGRRQAAIRLVDPRCGGRVVASCPVQRAA